jgi:YYY domain-containing protein
MKENKKTILALFAVLIILAVGWRLRATGMGWGMPGYYHPDERGIVMHTDGIRFKEVPRQEEEGWWAYTQRAVKENLEKDSPLNIKAFHYGTFPYYVMSACRGLFNSWRSPGAGFLKSLPGLFFFLPVLLAVLFALGQQGENREHPLGKITWIFLCAAFPAGLILIFIFRLEGFQNKFYTAESAMIHYLPFLVLFVFCLPAVLWILYKTWMDSSLSKTSASARIRIALLLFSAIALSWLLGWGLPGLLERRWGYDNLGYIGRSFSALAAVGTIALTYSYGSRCYNRRVGLMACLFLTFTVLHIQLSHYSAFDVVLGFFIMAALNAFERIQSRGAIRDYVSAGILVGAAVACKFSALPLAFLITLPHLILFFGRLLAGRNQRTGWNRPLELISPWVGLGIAVGLGFATTFVLEPFAFIDSETFWRSIEEQRRMVTGEALLPYTIQYLKTAPVFYPLYQLLMRGFGLPLGVAVFAGWVYCLVRQVRRPDRATLLLIGWSVPSFLVYASFQVKYPRYFITIIPALCIFGALFFEHLLQWAKEIKTNKQKHWISATQACRWTMLFLGIVLIGSAAYSFAFVTIYQKPHSWEVASDWIYNNVPKGSRILAEHWDDDLPKGRPTNNRHRMSYDIQALSIYDRPDNESKIQKMCRKIEKADYIILATKRGYGSILRAPELYPLMNHYYRALFSGSLGFEPERVFTGAPRVFGLQLSDDLMDESLRVYDHPKSIVFKKTGQIPASELQAIILNPPRWVESITYEEVLTLQDKIPVFAQTPRFPLIRWYLLLQLVAVIFFPLLFPFTRHLRDGGWSLARPAGILMLAYTGWVLSSLKVVPFGTSGLWMLVFIFALAALVLYKKYWDEIRSRVSSHLSLFVVQEILWLAALALFIGIRMYNPDIYWGEKPMDTSFLAASYRTEWFPPDDPWFAGSLINYYYYGHVVFSTLGLLAKVPVHYLYNLAVGTIPALVALGAFGLLFNLTRRFSYGLLAAYLVTLSGSLNGYFQMTENLGPIPPPKAEAATAFQQTLSKWPPAVTRFPQTVGMAWDAATIPLGKQSELAQGETRRPGQESDRLWRLVGFDSYFWKVGHDVIPHTVANEFPIWTFLFADLHAHMIVMPFTLLLVGLAFALLCRPRNHTGLELWWGGLLLCLTIGNIFCVNAWDFPASVLLLLLVLWLRWWKFPATPNHEKINRVEYLLGPLRPGWKKALDFLYGLVAEVFFPLAAIVFAGIILYLPFHLYFDPRVRLGPESVLVSLGNMTLLSTYLKIFGLFLFLIASSLLLRWQRIPGRSGKETSQAWSVLLILLLAVLVWTFLPAQIMPWGLWGVFAASLFTAVFIRGRWTFLVLATVLVIAGAATIFQASDTILQWIQTKAQADELPPFILYRGHFQNILFNFSTAAMLFPLWLMATVLLFRWAKSREDTFSLVLAWMGLSIAIGVEVVFIKEGWEHPAHRYNTVFKFFLQVWIYMALAAAAGLYWIRAHRVSRYPGKPFKKLLKLAWNVVLVLLLIGSAMFPIFGTYAVTMGPGARCVKGPRPHIDGLLYMNEGRSQSEFNTIHWVNRFIEGQPTMVEEAGTSYHHDTARISTNTGVPTVIGWIHHMRERAQFGQADQHNREINTRERDIGQLYRKQDKRLVLDLLGKYQVDYLYVGTKERQQYGRDVRKFLGYGDALDLLYRTQGGEFYRVRKNLNEAYLGQAAPLPPPGEKPKESGINMYVGGSGFDNGNFNQPRGITFDTQGRAYVADTFNHRIQVFDPKGEFLFTFGEKGELEGQFREPNNLLITPKKELLVLDTWNHRVQVFTLEGTFLYQFGRGFFGPRGIALGPKGRIYITDTGSGQIKVFSGDGQFIEQWAGKGQELGEMRLDEPIGIAVGEDGHVFVADTGNKKIKVFNQEGRLYQSWDLSEHLRTGRGNEEHLLITPGKRLLLSDPAGGQILVLSLEGKLLGNISRDGTLRAPIGFPLGMNYNPITREITVCDQQANRMIRFSEKLLP